MYGTGCAAVGEARLFPHVEFEVEVLEWHDAEISAGDCAVLRVALG
jgi:hypothetical protein